MDYPADWKRKVVDGVEVVEVPVVKPRGILGTFWWVLRLWLADKLTPWLARRVKLRHD